MYFYYVWMDRRGLPLLFFVVGVAVIVARVARTIVLFQ